MDNKDHFRFVSLLALELDNGDISLPSLPDVVIRIRDMLERDDVDFDKASHAISVDPVLVSRLFVLANSAYYNRANLKIETLDAVIGRLGFEVVRNTAMSLAMQQLYNSDKHEGTKNQQRKIWARGMKLSSMAFAIAQKHPTLNQETAFLCGLMHEVGKLYILTKAGDFPALLGDAKSLQLVFDEWNPQISKSIMESWGFSEEIVNTADPDTYSQDSADDPADLVDVVVVAGLLLDGNENHLEQVFEENESCLRLGVGKNAASAVMAAYRDKLQNMQQSLS